MARHPARPGGAPARIRAEDVGRLRAAGRRRLWPTATDAGARDGETERTVSQGAGLVAATRLGGEAPTWIVTGTDAVGLAAAAAQLDEDSLADKFAIAVEDGRPVPLPIVIAEEP